MSRALSRAAASAPPPGGIPREPFAERPIDLVHLARQTFGDKRLETELLRLFVRQAEQIKTSLERGAPLLSGAQPIGDALHMLQGSARAVGATAVADLAHEIEARWRQAGADSRELPTAARRRLSDAVDRTNAYIASLLGPQ